ncbi:MAG: hypothetical protein ACD_4C00204G0001, partial [uncultured bacterium (gcode 4)]
MYFSKKAFTLVELIVVITILAILWTIAFLSYSSYTSNSRDSSRITDLKSISKSIDTYKASAWKLPLPWNSTQITYSWGMVWTQWTFSKQTQQIVWNISPLPIDPLYQVEYTYSTLNDNKQYEIAWITEGTNAFYDNSKIEDLFLTPKALSATQNKKAFSYIVGNYNWMITKTTTWAMNYVLALPSIIWVDVWTYRTIESMVWAWGNLLAIHEQSNISDSYKTTNLILTWSSIITPLTKWTVVVWSWASLPADWNETLMLAQNIKQAYSWTTVINWNLSDL